MAVNNNSSGVVSVHQPSPRDDWRRVTLAYYKSCFAGAADEDVYAFMDKVERYMNLYGITEEEAFKQLLLVLDGKAAEWWRCFRHHFHSWDEAKSDILHHFGKRNSIKTFLEHHWARRPPPDENACDDKGPPNPKHETSTSSSSLSSTRPAVYIYDDSWWDLKQFPYRFYEDEDVHDFIEKLELFITVKGIPFDFALSQLHRILKGPATMWWDAWGDSLKTWEEAMTAFRERFGYRGGHISFVRLHTEVQQRRQQPHERAIDYIISISSMMRKMNPPLGDSLQADYIFQGLGAYLKYEVAVHVIAKDKLNPLQLTSEVIRIEECLRVSKKK